jgi:branched-chain amino acid transport system substrate-binding protein
MVGVPALIGRAAPPPIKIGVLMDRTGALYSFGTWGEKAAIAAVKTINAQGGIAGRKVEFASEDSATNVQTGLRKVRKLIQKDKCDFIVGPCNSGISVAAAPVAESMNTVFFAWGTALSITGKKANKYMFRGINNARHGMIALAQVAAKQMGKRYWAMGADYEWGRSVVQEWRNAFDPLGGKFVGESYSPVKTDDFVPYLNKIDANKVDILVGGYFTGDILKLARQAYEKGLLKKLQIVAGAMPTGLSVKDLGPAAPNIWFTGYFVRRMANVPDNLKPYNKAFRKTIGLDDEGLDVKTKKVASASYCWTPWEHIYWIKQAVEKSGWQSKDDNPKFIQTLEGMEVKAGPDFITGDKFMRAQDHQVFMDQYVVRIEKGNFRLKGVAKGKDLIYKPEVDLTKVKA